MYNSRPTQSRERVSMTASVCVCVCVCWVIQTYVHNMPIETNVYMLAADGSLSIWVSHVLEIQCAYFSGVQNRMLEFNNINWNAVVVFSFILNSIFIYFFFRLRKSFLNQYYTKYNLEPGWFFYRRPSATVHYSNVHIIVVISIVVDSFCFDLFQMNIRGYEFVAVSFVFFVVSMHLKHISITQLNAIVNFIKAVTSCHYSVQ